MKNLDTNEVLCRGRDSLTGPRRTGTMHHLKLLILLLQVFAAHGVLPLAINKCVTGGSVNIPENTWTASFTCSGLWRNSDMYWTIQGPGETRPTIGNCLYNNSMYSCTINSTYAGLLSLNRYDANSGYSVSTLYFNDLQFIDGATVYCNQGTTQPASCTIRITNLLPRTINECRSPNGSVEIPQNAVQPFFTCSGLWWSQNMSWTIDFGQLPNQPNPTKIGNCLTNINETFSPSYVCTVTNPALTGKFNVTRSTNGSVSTLFFNDLDFTNKARIFCNQQLSSGLISTSCKVQVIEPYKLQECQNGAVELAVNGARNITCTGLQPLQNMDWIVTLRNGAERVMYCNSCPSIVCPMCTMGTMVNSNLRPSRGDYSSQLTLYDNNGDLDGATVTCVKRDQATQDQCQVNAVDHYSIRNCENNAIELQENNYKRFYCDGPKQSHPIDWTIVYHNGNVKRFDCTAIVDSSVNCQPGDDPRISLFRLSATENYLAVTDNNRDLDGAVVTCSSPGNVSMAQCRITVTWRPGDLMLDNSSCPASVKAGNDVACRCSLPSDQLGSPPGHVVWNSTSGTEAPEQDQTANYSILHVRKVQTVDNGIVVFACRALWGTQNETVGEMNYTFEVVEDGASQATRAPIAAVAGGVAGAGVLLIIIIIVVIVVVRRRGSKRDRPKQKAQPPQGPSRNSDEFVEFVNDGYMSADQFDGDGRLRAAAATSSADGGGVYSNADAMEPKPNAQNQNIKHEAEGNDVYAQVQKKPKGVVNKQDVKKPKGDKKVKAEKPAKGEKSRDAENAKGNDAMGENIYASGTDPSEYYNVSALANTKKDNSGDVYMNVSENSPSKSDGATPGAGADDGVYNELNDQQDRRNPTYNRLNDM